MSGEQTMLVAVKIDELRDAAACLPTLAELLGTYYEKMNFDGEGQLDAAEVKRDVLTGARACAILLNAIEEGENHHGKH